MPKLQQINIAHYGMSTEMPKDQTASKYGFSALRKQKKRINTAI
jgi:hypothetical protein